MSLVSVVIIALLGVVLVYALSVRDQRRAARGGRASDDVVRLAIRMWAYERVLAPIILVSVIGWVIFWLVVYSWDEITAPPPPPGPKAEVLQPPEGYQWGPNGSLVRLTPKAPRVPTRQLRQAMPGSDSW